MLSWRLSDEAVTDASTEQEKDPESPKCKIFLGFRTRLISSGARESIRYLVQHRMVDVIVTTTGLEEDIMKCLADVYIDDGSLSDLSDVVLWSEGFSRADGKMLVPNDNSNKFVDWLKPVLDKMLEEQKRGMIWTDCTVAKRFGREIRNESSYLYWADKNDIPVYCPLMLSGELGRVISTYCPDLLIGIVHGDNKPINQVVDKRPGKTGMIVLGGLPCDKICCTMKMSAGGGADYAVFINDFAVVYDGLASSDAAIRAVESKSVEVICDPTIAFPLLVAETFATRGH